MSLLLLRCQHVGDGDDGGGSSGGVLVVVRVVLLVVVRERHDTRGLRQVA